MDHAARKRFGHGLKTEILEDYTRIQFKFALVEKQSEDICIFIEGRLCEIAHKLAPNVDDCLGPQKWSLIT